MVERYLNEQISEIRAANRIRPVHLLTLDENMKVAFYLSEIGSAMAGTDVIEINWKTGSNKFILFGSAGALDQEATAGKYVIPTAAYRDEGMSYHYAPPSDYISIPKADDLERFFSKNHLPFVKGFFFCSCFDLVIVGYLWYNKAILTERVCFIPRIIPIKDLKDIMGLIEEA